MTHILNQAKEILSPDLLIIILGPTASGKTSVAVNLAKELQGEIISADSRQIYCDMNIGTGKDLISYDDIPYHLIDIKSPGEKYNVDSFKQDCFTAYDNIISRGKRAILCGGTGSYIQAVLQDKPYAQIPKNKHIQEELSKLAKEELIFRIHQMDIPTDLQIDMNSHKRLVRALEILLHIKNQNINLQPSRVVKNYRVFGLNPALEIRREQITKRLHDRLEQGLVEEVKNLIANGLSFDDLIYYGLEYKYTAFYLQNKLSYDQFVEKLNVEIHRYAKRQMTYFRKMEKDGIKINWL